MGLKTTNFFSKSLNYIFPSGYAILKDLVLNGNRGTAYFVVQQTREDAETHTPFEKVHVDFDWDRNENPVVAAYKAAKSEVIKKQNEATGEETTEYGVLYAWQDDIVPTETEE